MEECAAQLTRGKEEEGTTIAQAAVVAQARPGVGRGRRRTAREGRGLARFGRLRRGAGKGTGLGAAPAGGNFAFW